MLRPKQGDAPFQVFLHKIDQLTRLSNRVKSCLSAAHFPPSQDKEILPLLRRG